MRKKGLTFSQLLTLLYNAKFLLPYLCPCQNNPLTDFIMTLCCLELVLKIDCQSYTVGYLTRLRIILVLMKFLGHY